MGLTIHYELTTSTGGEANARKLVHQLRQAALDLPFAHVGEIVELRGDKCDYKQRADNDPYRWLLIQAGTFIALPVTPAERRRGVRRDIDGFLGVLKDAMGHAPGAGTVEAPIAAYPNFEHLEAEGQRLLPEQLKAMLKALARSNLLRGDAC